MCLKLTLKVLWVLSLKVLSWVLCTFIPIILLVQSNSGNTKAMCKNCSKLTIKTPERRQ